MASVTVSAARVSSMLKNRSWPLDRVAEGLKISVDLSALVTSDQELDFKDVEALAKRFKVQWPYLLIDEPEVVDSKRHDNRTLLNRMHPLTAELLDQLAAAEAMLDGAAEYFADVTYGVPRMKITRETPVPDAAAAIRDLLGVSADDQLKPRKKRRDPYASLALWAGALQRHGVFVSNRRLEDETVRAFSIVRGRQAVVVADTQDEPYARVFSLLHE